MGWSGFPQTLTWDRILSLAHVYHTGSQHTDTGTCLTHHREEAPPQKAFKDRFGRNTETAMLWQDFYQILKLQMPIWKVLRRLTQ